VVALRHVTAERRQQLPGLPVLDALRHHLESEIMAERDRRPDDRFAPMIDRHRDHELPVDLHRVHRKRREIPERRVPGAEVIDRNDEPELPDDPDRSEGPLRRAHEGRLGDLEVEPLRARARVAQELSEQAGEQRILHRLDADVHRDAQVGRPLAPGRNERRRLAEDRERETRGRAAALGERDEDGGRDLAAYRIEPPGKRLEPDDRAVAEIDLWLERDPYPAAGQRRREIRWGQGSTGTFDDRADVGLTRSRSLTVA